MSTATAFLDTNVLLHYRRLREVDWLKIFATEAVRLVLCPCVLAELDKHKETHHLPKIRRRAGELLTELDGLLDQGTEAEIRPGGCLHVVATRLTNDVSSNPAISRSSGTSERSRSASQSICGST